MSSKRGRPNRSSSRSHSRSGSSSSITVVRRSSSATSRSTRGSSTRPSVMSTSDQRRGRARGPVRRVRAPQSQHRACDLEVGALAVLQDQRVEVARVGDGQLVALLVEEQHAQGRELGGVVLAQHAFEAVEDDRRRVPFEGVGAQGVPQLDHHGGRVDRVPGDVADGDEQPPVVELDELVEVAADLGVVGGGDIPGRDLQPATSGQPAREEAALQGQREVVLLGVEAQRVEGEHRRLPDLGEQADLLGPRRGSAPRRSPARACLGRPAARRSSPVRRRSPCRQTGAGSGKGMVRARARPGRDLGQYGGRTLSTTGAEGRRRRRPVAPTPSARRAAPWRRTPKTAAVPAAMAAVSWSNAVAFCIARSRP